MLTSLELLRSACRGSHDRVQSRSRSVLALELTPVVNTAALQTVFDLTVAEAKLASDIATGRPLAKIAAARRLSMSTCRTQLQAIFAKTRTCRQAELVALLTRISILP
jgi:DNA-binding CsgD family transcriptional regulator